MDTGCPTAFFKSKEIRVVKKHLRDDIVGTSIHLPLEILDIDISVRSLEMLLRIACHTDTEAMVGGFY